MEESLVTREEFEQMIKEAINLLPQEIVKKLENVEFVVEEEGSPGGYFFALYHGVPQSGRGAGYTFVLPDKITFFKKTMERYAGDRQDLKRLVRQVVWHEIAHHFGFSEEGVRKLERRWKDSK